MARVRALILAYTEFDGVITVLHEDLQFYAEKLDHPRKRDADRLQFWRRAFVRALFAFIEGTLYRMKQIALASQFPPTVDFSLPEQALLAEESYDLDDNGNARAGSAKISLSRNIKFSFRAFAKAYLAEFELKTNERGWDAFTKSIKIRDRLTHPKLATDLIASELEARLLLRAFTWFEGNLKKAQNVGAQAMEANQAEHNKNGANGPVQDENQNG